MADDADDVEAIEYTDANGEVRRLGNLEPPKPPAASWPKFGSTAMTPLIKRAEWKKWIDESGLNHRSFLLPPAHHQQQTSMCNASATAGAMESQRMKQALTPRSLSAADLYQRICGGVDKGSYLEDGLRVARDEGIATIDTVDYLAWNKATPTAAVNERTHYMVTKAYLCPDFDHCMSAVLQGYDLISGIIWYSNYVPGSDGWLPAPGAYVGGHAVHGYKATYRQVGGKMQYGIWHQNSWGPNWGLEGRCVFPESVYTNHVGGWWAVVQVTQSDGV